jgi:hypothetical protein
MCNGDDYIFGFLYHMDKLIVMDETAILKKL